MITITVKAKFKLTGKNETKTVKIELEFPSGDFPCFPEIVDKVYYSNDPKISSLFTIGYIIGVELIVD